MRKGDSHSKVGLYLLLLVGLVALIPASLLYFNANNSGITSAATAGNTTVSVTINSAPTINNIGPITSQTISESSTTAVAITFNVTDADGTGDINITSAQIRVNFSNDPNNNIRFNNSCLNTTTVNSTTIAFTCTVSMWYFDSEGNWTINASARDLVIGAYAENHTFSFELQQTTAMVIAPTALTWALLEKGTFNRTSTNDPIIINNTGNKNISGSGLTVDGKDLRGVNTPSEHLGVANFSVASFSSSCAQGGACMECNGTMLFNGSSGASGAKPIINANITRGNNSINSNNGTSGQEDLYFCLQQLASEISRQTYDTSNYGTWTIAVS